MSLEMCKVTTLQEESRHWNLNFAISLNTISLNFNSTNYQMFEDLSMDAYITKLKYLNSLIYNSVNLTILGQVAKLNSVYIFTLQGSALSFCSKDQ